MLESKLLLSGLVSGLILLSGNAIAQDIDASERIEAEPVTASEDWDIEIGAAIGAIPDFPGAEALQGVLLPYFHIEYRDRYFLHPTSGAGVYLLNEGANFISTSVTWSFGRQEDDAALLTGLGDIDGGAALRIAGQYQFTYFVIGAFATHQVTGSDTGTEATLYAATRLTPTPRTRVYPTVRIAYADDERQRAFYGVTAAQAATSAFDQYTANGGLKSYGAQLQALHDVSADWKVAGQVSWDKLVEDAADSPISQDDNQYFFSLGVIRKF